MSHIPPYEFAEPPQGRERPFIHVRTKAGANRLMQIPREWAFAPNPQKGDGGPIDKAYGRAEWEWFYVSPDQSEALLITWSHTQDGWELLEAIEIDPDAVPFVEKVEPPEPIATAPFTEPAKPRQKRDQSNVMTAIAYLKKLREENEKRPTIRVVAEKVGCSHSTLSRSQDFKTALALFWEHDAPRDAETWNDREDD